MKRGAVLGFDDTCRFMLERNTGEPDARTAAWLMCNPSTADANIDDPTANRVVHHSARLGCARSIVGNVWAWRTPYPAQLWADLRAGRYTQAMADANRDALAAMGAQADVFVVAFGAAPWRAHRTAVTQALYAWLSDDGRVPECLGVTPDGAPLHPLARGKFAVRNDCEISEWPGVLQL